MARLQEEIKAHVQDAKPPTLHEAVCAVLR